MAGKNSNGLTHIMIKGQIINLLRGRRGQVRHILRSELIRRSSKNAVYSVIAYMVPPLLAIALTPFFISRLGVEAFGIWMLSRSILGVSGVLNLGLGDATIKYVASYRSKNDADGINQVVGALLCIHLFMGLVSFISLWFISPILARSIFKVSQDISPIAVDVFRITAIGLFANFVSDTIGGVIKGCERYDLASQVDIVTRLGMIVFAALILVAGGGLRGVVVSMILAIGLRVILYGRHAKNLVDNLQIRPKFSKEGICEVWRYGAYSTIMSLGTTVFGQADKIIISYYLGPAAVTYYTVPQQVAMQIHAVFSRGLGFLFPLSSAFQAEKRIDHMWILYDKTLNLVILLASSIGIFLFVLSEPLLTIWMGEEFAEKTTIILQIQIIAYSILATSVVPYYFLNGSGNISVTALFTNISGAWNLLLIFFLVPIYGVIGAAIARVGNLFPMLIDRVVLHKRVFNQDWPIALLYFIPLFIQLGAGVYLHNLWPIPTTSSPSLFFLLLNAILVSFIAMGVGSVAILLLHSMIRPNLMDVSTGDAPG